MIILFVRMILLMEVYKYKIEILKNMEILNLIGEILMKEGV